MIGEQKHWLQNDGKRKEGDTLVEGTYQLQIQSKNTENRGKAQERNRHNKPKQKFPKRKEIGWWGNREKEDISDTPNMFPAKI